MRLWMAGAVAVVLLAGWGVARMARPHVRSAQVESSRVEKPLVPADGAQVDSGSRERPMRDRRFREGHGGGWRLKKFHRWLAAQLS